MRRQLCRHHERHPRRVGGLPRLPRQRRIHRHPPLRQRNRHPRPAGAHALPHGGIADRQEPTHNLPFKDVATTDPDYPAIIWAADAGITSGWEDELFHPDDYATRHTLAVFLYRAAGSPDGAAHLRQIRRPLRAEKAAKKTEQFKTENRWAVRTLGAYPEVDRDGDGVADVVNPASPLYFSDALYMLKAYGDKGLKVVGTPTVD